jgi:DNA-binding response OmpR family regulator
MGIRRPPCILVVTDEPLVRHMVARLLASQGYAPLVAEGGEADFGSLAGASLALILINTYRPDLNGSEAVERVSAAFPGVPVLHLEEALLREFSLDGLLQSVRTLTHSERRKVARRDGGSEGGWP